VSSHAVRDLLWRARQELRTGIGKLEQPRRASGRLARGQSKRGRRSKAARDRGGPARASCGCESPR
jgi:hypothetical protein